MTVKAPRTRHLATIHAAAKQLGMDDATRLDLAQLRAMRATHVRHVGVLAEAALRRLQRGAGAAQMIEHAIAIARQMFRRQRLEWLKPAELRAVITALVIEQRKRDLLADIDRLRRAAQP